MTKSRKPADRIKDFTSLAEYKAKTAKEGEIDTPIFDGSRIRRIVFKGVPHYSTIDVIGALTESDNPASYWGKLKERLAAEGAGEVLTNCQNLPLPGRDGKMYPGDCADIETLLAAELDGEEAWVPAEFLAQLDDDPLIEHEGS